MACGAFSDMHHIMTTTGSLLAILVTPSANQGPLLGIFFTGPLGMVLGFVWGLIRAARRRRSGPDAA